MSDAMRIEDYEDYPEKRMPVAGRHYTYADYLEWEGPQRYELINGEVFQMASPSVAHQAISGELFGQFFIWLKGKPCQVFAAPLDVRLFPQKDKSDNTVVQEYWMISPEMKAAHVHIYENGHYISTVYEDNDHISVTILPELEIALEDLWARIPGS